MHRNKPKGKTIYFSKAQMTFPAASARLQITPNSPIVAKAEKSITIEISLLKVVKKLFLTVQDEIIVSFIKNSPKLLYRDKYNTQHYKSQIKT